MCILLQRILNNIMDTLGLGRCFASLKGSVVLFTPIAAAHCGGTRPTLQQSLLTLRCHPFLPSASRRDIVRRKSEVTLRKGSGMGNEGWRWFPWGLCSKFESINCVSAQVTNNVTKPQGTPLQSAQSVLRHRSQAIKVIGRRKEN